MATGSTLLPIGAAVLPDGLTSNVGPAMQWAFRMQADYA
jgi:hypothetical protein